MGFICRQRKIVDENLLGEEAANATAECLGLTWVDPDEIADSSAGGKERFMLVRAPQESLVGSSRNGCFLWTSSTPTSSGSSALASYFSFI